MVLNDIQIEQAIRRGHLVVPRHKQVLFAGDYCSYACELKRRGQIQPASLDVTLGDSFKKPKKINGCYSMNEPIEYEEVKPTYGLVLLPPKTFMLATTNEVLDLPDDVTAFVEGRSSIGRMGLFVQNAGWVDPGFKGEITLELFNACDVPIQLEVGRRVAQLVFEKMSNPCEFPYRGKYQNQTGATASKIYYDEDKE